MDNPIHKVEQKKLSNSLLSCPLLPCELYVMKALADLYMQRDESQLKNIQLSLPLLQVRREQHGNQLP